MRIFFVRPAQIHWRHEAKRVGTPIGLLGIAALARQHHDVAFLDVSAEGYDSEMRSLQMCFDLALPGVKSSAGFVTTTRMLSRSQIFLRCIGDRRWRLPKSRRRLIRQSSLS